MHTIRLSVALALLLGSLGCGKKDGPATTKDSKVEMLEPKTSPSSATLPPVDAAPALAAAKNLLKAIQEGKATSANFTQSFKSAIAPPELGADRAEGFAESGVRQWLGQLKWEGGTTAATLKFANADYAIVKTPYSQGEKDGSANVYIWILRQGSEWIIADLLIDQVFGQFNIPDGEQAGPAFAAWSFSQAVREKSMPKVEARLTRALKAKLAPPNFDEDKVQGYSSSSLKSAFSELFATPLGISSVELTGAAAKVNVTTGGVKKILEIKLVPGASSGEFLIDDYQQK